MFRVISQYDVCGFADHWEPLYGFPRASSEPGSAFIPWEGSIPCVFLGGESSVPHAGRGSATVGAPWEGETLGLFPSSSLGVPCKRADCWCRIQWMCREFRMWPAWGRLSWEQGWRNSHPRDWHHWMSSTSEYAKPGIRVTGKTGLHKEERRLRKKFIIVGLGRLWKKTLLWWIIYQSKIKQPCLHFAAFTPLMQRPDKSLTSVWGATVLAISTTTNENKVILHHSCSSLFY